MSERVIEQVEQISRIDQTRALLQAMGLPLTYMSPELEALVSETVEITALAIQELDKLQPDLQGPAKDEALKDLRAQIRATTDIDATEYAFRKAAIQKFGQGRVRSIDHFAFTLSNSVPALVPKASRELDTAFKQGDADAVQMHTEILEQFNLQVTLPETSQADVVVAPVKTNVAPLAKVATVGAIVVGIGFGAVAPAAATSSSPSPNASVSAPANQEQPSAELVPVVQSPEAQPSATTPTVTQPETTTPSTAPSQPEQTAPAPTETQPEPSTEPVVQGVETTVADVQAPVFSKEVTSPVITVQEIVDPTADQEPPAEEQPDVLTNDELQEFVKKLDPEYAKIYTNLIGAYKSGNLNGFSDETAFNVANPYVKGQKLNLHMSKKVQEQLLLDTREFQEILKNNPTAIEALINDESIVIDDALKEQLAEYIQSNDFIKGAEGLTIEQRIALVKSTIKIHELVTKEALRVAPKELAAAKKNAEALAPKVATGKSKYDQLVEKAKKTASFEGLENYELSAQELSVIDDQKLTPEQKAFIKRVYPILIKYQDKYQYNAMIVMSMIIQENNLNPDNDLFTIAHNVLSIKAPSGYDGPTFDAPTWEQYDGSGEKTIISNETWIKFESDEACIKYFVQHILGLKAYDDAQAFYKSPELFVMGLLNNMQKDGDVNKAHHLGATSYATALNYVYGALTLSSQYGFDKVGPANYRVGYDWSSKTTDGFIIPNQVRGNTFYHAANTKYASEIGAGSRATVFASVAMVISHFSKSNVNPAAVKERSNNGSSLREVLSVAGNRNLSFEKIKPSSHTFATELNGKEDAVILVQGKRGAYVIDMATDGNGKQGFFVLDPSSTVVTLEPWSFSELQTKLGVTQAYVVNRKSEIVTLPYRPSDKPGITQSPRSVEPRKPLKRLSKGENAAVIAAAAVGLTTKDLNISTKRNGTHQLDIKPQSAVDILGLKPYGGYPLRLRQLPKDAVGTQYNLYSRECVDYVALRIDTDKVGMGFPRWGGRISEGYGGVAYKWISNAKKDGIRVDNNPTVGSTLAWDKSGRDHIAFGHVAYVEAVLPDGSIIVSQYNNGGTGKYSVELITKEYLRTSNNTAFVHFEEGRNSDLPRNTRPHDDSY